MSRATAVFLISLIAVLNIPASSQESNDTVDWGRVRQVSEQLTKDPSRADLGIVPADLLPSVLELLRRQGRGQLGIWPDPASAAVLLKILDEPFASELTNQYKRNLEGMRGEAIKLSGQPRLVLTLANELTAELGVASTPIPPTIGALPPSPRAIIVQRVVLGLLSRSDEVTADVRVWASIHSPTPVLYKFPVVRFHKMMTDWWVANKQAFAEERFADVKPGETLVDAPGAVTHSAKASQETPSASKSETIDPHPAVAIGRTPDRNHLGWLVLGLALALAMYAVWSRRRPQSPRS